MKNGIFGKIIYFLTKLKLSVIRKFLNFSVNRDVKRGFIIVQIDGLSCETLKAAIQKGYMPRLNGKILNDKFSVKSFYSGMPSNTPNFQKQLMFGDEEPVPGFRWFDKTSGKFFTFTSPETAEFIEKSVKNKSKTGILKGGASYYNIFSGDADRSYLTLSKIFHTNMRVRLTGFKLFILTFLNFFTLFKIIFSGIKEIVREFKDQLFFFFNDLTHRRSLFFPLLRVFNNVIITEYNTNAVCLEILSGTPKIYVTFNAYDEISHQRGPFHRGTMKTLKVIDKSIYKIYGFAKNSTLRKYDFYILSDHGEAPSLPFYKIFRKNLKDVILRYGRDLKVGQHHYSPLKSESFNIFILKKLSKLSQNSDIPKIFSRFDFTKGRVFKMPEKFTSEQVNIVSFGPVSHVYFTKFKDKLDFNKINDIFPFFIIHIIAHKSVGAIGVQDKDGSLLLFKNGYIKLREGKIAEKKVKKDTFFEKIKEKFIDKSFVCKDIDALINLRYSGDLIIFSNFIADGVINFEDQMSCHGGIGDGQTDSFIIFPNYRMKKISKVYTPLDLHGFFKENY